MKYLLLLVLLISGTSAFAATKTHAANFDLNYAKSLAAKAVECAQKNNWKISIAIVNSEGNLLYFERNDDSFSGSIEAAIQKAKSANAFQRPTSAFVDGIKQGRIGLVTVKDVVAMEGGVPIS
ncbi:MAG: GlcG/HbpS family heme-binding protein, partial [Bacteriovoracaceae bacterium]